MNIPTQATLPIGNFKLTRKPIAGAGGHWLLFDNELDTTWLNGFYREEEARKDMNDLGLAPGQRVLYRLDPPRSSQSYDGDWDCEYDWREVYRERISPRAARWRWVRFDRAVRQAKRFLAKQRRIHQRKVLSRPQDLYIRFSYTHKNVMSPVESRTARLYSSTRHLWCWVHDHLAEVTIQGNPSFPELTFALAEVAHAKYPQFPIKAILLAPRQH